MIVTTAQLFKVAYGKFAIGAYNINNAEQTMGLFKGCLASQAPFIIQISKGARKYTDKRMLEAIIRAAAEIFPEAIVFLNAVAHLAELANHHPDVDIRYTNVTVSLVTHDQGGLTPRDVSLARQIEGIRKQAAPTG